MELEELKNIWNDYDKKLDKSLTLNRMFLKKINLDKTESKLNKLVWLRVLEGACFLLVMIFLGRFIASNLSFSAPVISAFVLDIFAIIGLTGNIKQIVLLKQIDYSGSISSIQKQIETVKIHSFQVFKLMILSTPFYLAYVFVGFKSFFNVDLFSVMSQQDVLINLLATVTMVIPTIWIYRQLSYKHAKYQWVKTFINTFGGEQVASAMVFLKELEEFESDS